ncbi:hypothetical protein GGI43DRAFT_416789 [Trichoderma evansii]
MVLSESRPAPILSPLTLACLLILRCYLILSLILVACPGPYVAKSGQQWLRNMALIVPVPTTAAWSMTQNSRRLF